MTGLKTYRSTLEAQADKIKLPQKQRQAVAACLKDPTSDPTCSLILLGYQAGAKQSLDGAANGLTQKVFAEPVQLCNGLLEVLVFTPL